MCLMLIVLMCNRGRIEEEENVYQNVTHNLESLILFIEFRVSISQVFLHLIQFILYLLYLLLKSTYFFLSL